MDHTTSPSTPIDVVIIGAGAAGLTAAQVLGRARRTVTVIDGGRPRNAPAAHMHGYLGHDGLPPSDLLSTGRSEAATYGVTFVDADVRSADWRDHDSGFVVALDDGTVIETRALIVATGLTDVLPDVPGLAERWGRDVLHCPYCHGYEVRDRRIAVIGGESREMSVHQALLVPQWSSDVTFLTNGLDLTDDDRAAVAARGVTLVEGRVTGLTVTDDALCAVGVADGRSVPCDAAFVGPRFVQNDAVLRTLGCDVSANGFVTVDATGATSVAGVWAAGNVVNPRAQVITAAGEGSAAAIAVNASLVHDDVAAALRHRTF